MAIINSNLQLAAHGTAREVVRNSPNKPLPTRRRRDESHSTGSAVPPQAAETKPKKVFRFNELCDVQIVESLKLNLSAEQIKELWYESDELRDARKEMILEVYNAKVESEDQPWRGFEAITGGWCPVEKSSKYTSAIVKHYHLYNDPEALRKYAEGLTKDERQRVHKLAFADMEDIADIRKEMDMDNTTTMCSYGTHNNSNNFNAPAAKKQEATGRQRRATFVPPPASAKCTDYRSSCTSKMEEEEDQQPEWSKKEELLKTTKRGSMIKIGENLELPVTKINDVAKGKGLVSATPEWCKKKVLKPTVRGSMIKTGENLELPVTKIDDVAKERGLVGVKPQWTKRRFPSNGARTTNPTTPARSNSSNGKKTKKKNSATGKKQNQDQKIPKVPITVLVSKSTASTRRGSSTSGSTTLCSTGSGRKQSIRTR